MRLDNHNLASLEAYEPLTPEGEPLSADGHGNAPDSEVICVCQKPSALLSEMARNPPVLLQQPPPPLSPPPPSLGQGPDRRVGGAGDGSSGGRGSDLAPAPAEAPAEAPAAPVPVPAPVAVAAPPVTQPPPPATAIPTTDPTPLPLGPVVSAEWLTQREAALNTLRTDFEASREAARGAPPADVASAAPGWVVAPTDNDGLPVPGAVWVPDSGAPDASADLYGGQPAFLFRREEVAVAPPAGQWLAFDDGTYEQHYRDHLASRASAPLAQLYGEPAQDLFTRHPDLWTLATQAHALNAGLPPRPGLAMGSVDQLGPLDLYLADPFVTQLRTQLGGAPATPTSALAMEQQRLYGAQRYAELTQLDQALAAVRSEHVAAQQAAYAGGGIGWIDVPMQFGTDPETGQPTGVYATTGDGEVQRDANGVPVLATQRVFDEALFTNAWLADGERSGGLAQQAFARFYGHAHSQIVREAESASDSGGPPRWVSQAWLDNPHVALRSEGLCDNDLIALDLNHAPKLNDDAAVGFDPQLGWVTQRDNLYEHRDWFERAAPLALVVFVGCATGYGALAADLGAVGSAAVAGGAASFASGVVNGNLSLKGVLIGTVSAALTAGLTPQLSGLLESAGLGSAVAGVAARMTVQGGIQALLGGEFKDGAIAGFASGLADLASKGIDASITAALNASAMSPAEVFAARTFKTVLTSAITAAASPGDPANTFASAWLAGMVNGNLPPVEAPAVAQSFPVPDPGLVEVRPLPVNDAPTYQPPADSPKQADPPLVLLTDTADGSGPVFSQGRGPDLVGKTTVVPGEHTYPGQTQLLPGTLATLMQDEVGQQFWRLQGAQVPGGQVDVVMGSNAPPINVPPQTALQVVQAGLAVSALTGEALTGDALIALANRSLAAAGRAAVATLAEAAEGLAVALGPELLVLGLLVVPTNATEQIVPISDGKRFVCRPGDLYGTLQRQDSDGHWVVDKANVQLVQLGSARAALTDEEIRAWSGPLINVPPPTAPSTPPPLEPAGPLPPLPGSGSTEPLVGPPAVHDRPAETPLSIDDLIYTRDPDAQRRFRGEVCAEGFRLDPAFKPEWYDAHHIIPLNEYPDLNELRDRFAKWGIDLNSLANGVALPNSAGNGVGTPHADTQKNPDYVYTLRVRFAGAATREEALYILGEVKQELQGGTFVGPRKGKP